MRSRLPRLLRCMAFKAEQLDLFGGAPTPVGKGKGKQAAPAASPATRGLHLEQRQVGGAHPHTQGVWVSSGDAPAPAKPSPAAPPSKRGRSDPEADYEEKVRQYMVISRAKTWHEAAAQKCRERAAGETDADQVRMWTDLADLHERAKAHAPIVGWPDNVFRQANSLLESRYHRAFGVPKGKMFQGVKDIHGIDWKTTPLHPTMSEERIREDVSWATRKRGASS